MYPFINLTQIVQNLRLIDEEVQLLVSKTQVSILYEVCILNLLETWSGLEWFLSHTLCKWNEPMYSLQINDNVVIDFQVIHPFLLAPQRNI